MASLKTASLVLLGASALALGYLRYDRRPYAPAVLAFAETQPVPNPGDAADDPAICVDPQDPARTLILGTDKKGGLGVYDLAGRELQYLPLGNLNNVDARPNVRLGERIVTLAAASHKDDRAVLFFEVDFAAQRVVPLEGRAACGLKPEGIAFFRDVGRGGALSVFVVGRDPKARQHGIVEQYDVGFDAALGAVTAPLVRRFRACHGEAEGLVVDDDTATLYLSEEGYGIRVFAARSDDDRGATTLDRVGLRGNLVGDVEGLAIHRTAGGAHHLVASCQQGSHFATYRLGAGGAEFTGRFAVLFVDEDGNEDPVTDTDGIEISSAALPGHPLGIFVCHDDAQDSANQNFKLVSFEAIAERLDLELAGDS
jgi:3-phytase